MMAGAVIECLQTARMSRMRRNDPASGVSRAGISVAVSYSRRCKWPWRLHFVIWSTDNAGESPE